jgi:hypothetical protein
MHAGRGRSCVAARSHVALPSVLLIDIRSEVRRGVRSDGLSMTNPDRPDKDLLARAEDYPFELRRDSFVLLDSQIFDVVSFNQDDIGSSEVVSGAETLPLHQIVHRLGITPTMLSTKRTAVLAFGSNASPWQLTKKFAHARDTVLPVVAARLHDLDVVYSAHVSHYGSIPANLLSSPGTTVSVFVTYLTDEQLIEMHRSEARNYDPIELLNIALIVDQSTTLETIYCYLSRHGCLRLNGKPVRMQAFPAAYARFPSLSERQLLSVIAASLAPDKSLESFVQNIIHDLSYRQRCTSRLKSDAIPFDWPYWRTIDQADRSL